MEVIQTHAQCGNVASTLPMKSVLHCPRDIQHAVHLERKHECHEECAKQYASILRECHFPD